MGMLTRLCDIGRSCGRILRNRIFAIHCVKIIKFSLTDLLADNINVIGEVDLLDDFNAEARHESHNDREACYCPEGWLSECFGGGLVKVIGRLERGVNSCPEPYKQDTYDHKEDHKPIPSISVEQDVGIDDNDSRRPDVNTKPFQVADI